MDLYPVHRVRLRGQGSSRTKLAHFRGNAASRGALAAR
jgi:hypothetical protein